MIPNLIPLNRLAITRKIYMTKPIKDPHLKIWAGEYHYQEAINCPVPPPTCACCSQTRLSYPSEGDCVSSTHTCYIYNEHDISFKYENQRWTISFNPCIYNCYSSISYDFSSGSVDCNCPSIKHIDQHDYSQHWFHLYEGKQLLEKLQEKPKKKQLNHEYAHQYTYPNWLTNETLWNCPGIGCSDMCVDRVKHDHAKGAINFSDNQLARDIYRCCHGLSELLLDIMPKDIQSTAQKYESLTPLSQLLETFDQKIQLIINNANFSQLVHIVKTIRYEQFAPLEWSNDVVEYYEMYKNEYLNTQHVFLKEVFDGRYCLTTLVNGYIINYCDKIEKLTEMVQMTWPNRKIVILTDQPHRTKNKPKDVTKVIIFENTLI